MVLQILIMTLVLVLRLDPFEWLERGLVGEIRTWKKGSPPPKKLLQFPVTPPVEGQICGMRPYGDDVSDYLSQIRDEELLKALIFHDQGNAACVRSACDQLLVLRGVKHVRSVFADRRKDHPTDFQRSDIATMNQLLASSYIKIRVATLEKKDVSKEMAEKALARLKADLAAGITWNRAYGTASEMLFDHERSKKEYGGSRTFLCYRYDGLISATGFDLLDRRISNEIPRNHIPNLFEAKGGIHRVESSTTYWLYFVEAFYE